MTIYDKIKSIFRRKTKQEKTDDLLVGFLRQYIEKLESGTLTRQEKIHLMWIYINSRYDENNQEKELDLAEYIALGWYVSLYIK